MRYVIPFEREPKKRKPRNPVLDKLGRPRKQYAMVSGIEVVDAVLRYIKHAHAFAGDAERLAKKLRLGASPRAVSKLLVMHMKVLQDAGVVCYSVKVEGTQRLMHVLHVEGYEEKAQGRAEEAKQEMVEEATRYRAQVYARNVGRNGRINRAVCEATCRFMTSYTLATDKTVWVGTTEKLWQDMLDGTYRQYYSKTKPIYLQIIESKGKLARRLRLTEVKQMLDDKHITIEQELLDGVRMWVVYWKFSASKHDIKWAKGEAVISGKDN